MIELNAEGSHSGLVHRLGKATSRKGPGVRISSPPLLIPSTYKLGTELAALKKWCPPLCLK